MPRAAQLHTSIRLLRHFLYAHLTRNVRRRYMQANCKLSQLERTAMMLSTSHMAVFKPAAVSDKRLWYVSGLCPSMRQHAVARRVRLQAQEDKTQTETSSTPQQQQTPEELPIWVQREKMRELEAQAKPDLPWPLYLLFSTFVAIASVGSVFEYFDKNAIFGVIPPDSPLWAPILGLFAFTGIPTAGFLFFKGVNAANEAAERQDRMDGYIK